MLDVSAFRDVKTAGAGWTARCPAHEDARNSLSIGTGEGGRVLLKCHAGCALDDILAAAHLEHADLFPAQTRKAKARIVATYDYRDAGGLLLYQQVRMDPKDFRSRRPDGKGWIWNLGNVARVLYRLPDLQGRTTVYVVEGEKDADRLWSIGVPATTNAGGASSKWRPEYIQQLKGATVEQVVVLPDNDEPGRQHAEDVARSCADAGLKVKVVTLPDLPNKGDVSDWLDAHTKDELNTIVKASSLYEVRTTSDLPEPELAMTGIGDLLLEPDDAVDWLVHERIACGSLNILAGKPKAGKSTLARYLAYCMATGSPFLGADTAAGTVWYLVLEDKRSEVRRHFRALGATGDEPIRFVFGHTADLLGKLSRLAAHERPACIIVDTLQRLVQAKDLNDYAEVTTKLTPILTLARETGAAVILVHHAGKADRAGIDTILGSTALSGSVDNIFLVNRTDRYRLLSSIQRIGPDMPETVLTLDTTGRSEAGQTRHEADIAIVQDAMLQALQVAGSNGLTRAEWLESVEGRRQTKLEAIRGLGNQITRTGAGNRWEPYRYVSGSEVPSNRWEPPIAEPPTPRSSREHWNLSGSQVPVVPQVPEVPTGTTNRPDFVFDNDPLGERS